VIAQLALQATEPLRPLLKWPGGKHKVAPRIAALFPDGRCHAVWREPFLGSGAMFLHVADRLRSALLSDVNAGLVNFHRTVRDRPDDLLVEAHRLPLGEDWRDHYYAIRALYNTEPRVGVVAAARMLWLNRTAFNGLYRENASGGMNAPAGDYRTPVLPDAAHVEAVSRALGIAEIEVCDFADTVGLAGPGDWIYADPPYDPLTPSASFATYAKGGFGLADQERLARACAVAAEVGAHVVASNHGTERMTALWSGHGFAIEAFEVSRSISCKGDGRGKAPEILAHRRPV
jgi:DNA adenine methylase